MFVHIHTHAHTYILYAHKRAKVQTHSNTEISSRLSEALSLTHSILLLYPLLLEYTGVLTMWHTKLMPEIHAFYVPSVSQLFPLSPQVFWCSFPQVAAPVEAAGMAV